MTMTNILVCIETRGSAVQSISLELLTAARQLAKETGGVVEALVMGTAPETAVPSLGAADRILLVRHASLGTYIPEATLAVLVQVVKERAPTAVLFAYNTCGLDLAPALAQLSGRPLVAYCKAMSAKDGVLIAESSIYGGKLTAKSAAPLPAVVALMPGAFAEAELRPGSMRDIVEIAAPAKLDKLRMAFVSEQFPDADSVDITQASKIVSVGRGIKDKNGVETAGRLAAALGAELTGSRPIIDSGWLPKERQVGKSGRKVKPKLYLALGISGAPEHLEGMSGAELIIAVNTDIKAPIFSSAHYGTTCDVFTLMDAMEGMFE